MSTYVVSDLHGQYKLFLKGLEKIGFSDDDFLYVLGDAVDRGPDGIELLSYIKDHENMDLIIGNHEFMMLNAVDLDGKKECNGPDSCLWLYQNGGNVTFKQYCKKSAKDRKDLLEWLKSRYVIKTVKIGERTFCLTHSYYKESFENKIFSEMHYMDIWNIVWRSLYRYDWETMGRDVYSEHEEYTFITGHVPVQIVKELLDPSYNKNNCFSVYKDGNLLDIDGGCAAGYMDGTNGALFLRLDDMESFAIPLETSDGSE